MAAIAALLALGLAACSDPIRSGTVVERNFVPAHSETYLASQSCVLVDAKNGTMICTPIYSTRNVPDQWWVTLEADGRRDSWAIPEADWEKATVGSHLQVNEQ